MIFLSTSQNTKHTFAIAVAVYVIFTTIAFGSLSQHQFELDDLAYLKDLTEIRQDPMALVSAERRLPGRPITDLALLTIQSIFGNNPTAFHLAVVIAHFFTTCLLTLTFLKMGFNQELSVLGGFFFLINLAHFRAVQWISCLAYPLALGFGCVGILAYLAYQNSSRYQWYLLSSITFIIALLSHPAAIAFPIFTAYLTYHKKQPLRPILISTAIATIIVIGLIKLFPHVPQTEHATAIFHWQIINLFKHLLWYVGRLWSSAFIIFPNMSDIHTVDIIAGICALLGIAYLFYRRKYPITYWGIWMLLCLSVFITNANQTHFESGPSRHLYFASAGSSILLAYICYQISLQWKRLQISRLSLCIFTLIITTLSIVGLKKSEAFTYTLSARTLLVANQKPLATQYFEKAVKNAPDLVSSAMYERFLIANLSEGQFLNHSLHQGLAQYPDNARLVAIRMIYGFQSDSVDHQHLTNRVTEFAQQQNEDIQKFIGIACLNLGYHYTSLKQMDIAETLFQGALKIQTGYPEAAIHLSRIYLNQNKIPEAKQLLQTAVQHNPKHVAALTKLADLYALENNWEQAISAYKQVIEQAPKSKDLLFKLGYIYLAQKQYSNAKPLFETLTRLASENWRSFAGLGQCLHAEGNFEAAKQAYQKALQINPNQPEIKLLLNHLNQLN